MARQKGYPVHLQDFWQMRNGEIVEIVCGRFIVRLAKHYCCDYGPPAVSASKLLVIENPSTLGCAGCFGFTSCLSRAWRGVVGSFLREPNEDPGGAALEALGPRWS